TDPLMLPMQSVPHPGVIMNESLTFEAAQFPTEARLGAWHRRLGPGASVPLREISDEVGRGRRAFHRNLGPGKVLTRSAARREMEEPEVIGTDDRVQVKTTTEVPFRWICSLDLFFDDPDDSTKTLKFSGSGTLIGPRHVLTAAH